MEINNLSDENKEALQSKTWDAVREEFKKKQSVKHFTFGAEADNEYGGVWGTVVNTYLNTVYEKSPDKCNLEVYGIMYKVLRRGKITVFYDADGNTLFDVENVRMQSEYEWLQNNKGETATLTKELESIEDSVTTENGKNERKAQRAYASGADKIRDEVEAEYKSAKGKEPLEMMKGQMAPIVQYISEKCATNAEYNALVIQEHKTWKRCYDFLMSKARKMAAKGSSGLLVEGNAVLKWIDEYYKKDDKAEVEKIKKEELQKKEAKLKEKNTQKIVERDEGKSFEKPILKEQKESSPAKPKKKSREIEGQMDLLSMMGM